MANPRLIHRIDEIGTMRATFQADGTNITYERDQPFGTSKRYAPVKLIAEMQVDLCDDQETPFGSIERVEPDGSVVVAFSGAVQFKGTVAFGVGVVASGANATEVTAATTGTPVGTVVSQAISGHVFVVI